MQHLANIEVQFADFVRGFGGEVVEDLVGPSPDFANADYLFRDVGVVGELKRLVDDKTEDQQLQAKVQRLFDRWMAEGTIPVLYGESVRVESKTLPEACQKELIEVYKSPIQRRIVKASKQIKQTAERFRVQNCRGLLLLANDGNYALESSAVLYLVWRILGRNFHHINTVVYFTVNMLATSPRTTKPTLVWARANRKGRPPVPEAFLTALFDGWRAHLQKVVGVPFDDVLLTDLVQLEEVRYQRS